MSFLFIKIASVVQKHCLFTILHTLNMPYLWKWFSSKEYCLLCKQASSWNPLLGHFFSLLFTFGFSSCLNIKLRKITANKFCDMTFCLRYLHFKPLNIYKHIPLPKIKRKGKTIHISGFTTELGLKTVSSTSVPWIFSVPFGWAVVVFSRTWHMILNPFMGYPTTAERSDGRLISLWNICNTNLRTRPCIFWKLRRVHRLPY